ncbi:MULTISPECIES: hypothetical protein [Bradyrhizobium]|jgi:hypothetical protein|uniref:hypothetical protein n=1 Tax=Bradyrhizobium TaxID=374 RepID=UPI000231BF63|nr:hypothetical protein [Bradyrhizobium japonicum]AJA59377.1 hypothetical protein RN69_02290 [Bradyrhizobium japonicum]KMJ94983.1 hypothetical protein CF64_35020 [Bradyrhizobium japonicum]MBR0761961.1 hypothetical protein [Bradyrhizobium japonicum]MCS3535941.1 hypothetical protein [Bradyrhizobium japonicum]MCS3987958.1 hypothetical protein [Bradyrhizobium japonicum]
MQSPEASTAATPTQIHLALAALADEVVGTLARLFAYVGALVLFAILALAALDQLPSLRDDEPVEKPGWSVADRSQPAFALSRLDSSEKTASYVILRHPEGGRRDVMRWTGEADKPVAELEIYREGGEFDVALPATADLAVHMGLGDATLLEQAGLIDTKFGPVALFRPTGTAEGTRACLGYLKRSEEPALQISGFSCQGDTLPARRAAIACTLNRLTLLTSGNEPKLAELFAHAELKRRSCAPQGSSDWLLGAANAQLRGAL